MLEKNQWYPYLALVCNTQEAYWYYATSDHITQVKHTKESPETYSDSEGFYMSSAGGNAVKGAKPEVANAREAEHLHRFFRQVAEETSALLLSHDSKHVHILVPEQHKNLIEKELDAQNIKIPVRMIYGNYTHLDPQGVAKQVKEDLLPA